MANFARQRLEFRFPLNSNFLTRIELFLVSTPSIPLNSKFLTEIGRFRVLLLWFDLPVTNLRYYREESERSKEFWAGLAHFHGGFVAAAINPARTSR